MKNLDNLSNSSSEISQNDNKSKDGDYFSEPDSSGS